MRGYWAIAASLLLMPLCAQDSADLLLQAIRENNLATVKAQLAKGADVNVVDSRGNTLLMNAAVFGSTDAVKLVLERGANVNAKNAFDGTALIFAGNDLQKVRLLLDKGADVKAQTKRGRTALMVAATCDGCVEAVRLLIAKGADVNARDGNGGTALDAAAEANDLETMRLLLEHGANAKTVDMAGFTPLITVAAHCNLPAVRLLLSKGADVNAANTFAGEVKFGKIQIIHNTALMFAAPYCDADVMRTLLDAGARVNEKDSRDMNTLMFAVASEHQDLNVVNLLLKAGAEVNVKSNMGETALDWARKFNNRAVISALVAAGAQPGDPFTPPARKAGPARDARQGAQAGLAILQRTSTEFFKQSGCVGCHNQPIAIAAFSAAHAAGVPGDESTAKDHTAMVDGEGRRFGEGMLERIEGGGFTDPAAYSLFALGRAHSPPNVFTEAAALYVAGAQHRDGTWRVDGASRAPIQEGVIGRSVLAARAIQLYAPAARKPEMDQRLARTRDYLLEAKPSTNDDFAMRLLGLHWTGATAASVKAAGRALAGQQRPDGGWAQNPNLSSDAYASGESLWALREAGILAATDAAYQRGVKFLLDTQWEDGSWYVRSRAVKLQPYFQSGFPYDHDQWISSAATGFAVMALSPAAEVSKRASR